MDYQDIKIIRHNNGVAEIVLAKPQVHNAFNANTIAELNRALGQLSGDDSRALILSAEGKCFSAGADLNWMREQAKMSEAENLADSRELAALMANLDQFPKPSMALIQGPSFGGALGLAACCDIAIAHPSAKFCLSEVKLGIIPAVISPYVVRAMGMRQARRYMLTAEVFNAETAKDLGVVHEVADDLRAAAEPIVQAWLANGPQAMKTTKALLREVAASPINAELIEHTAETIAKARVSAEGQLGLNAFFERQAPQWSALNNSQES
ncbi:enoyl-CoA hydratase-related protein [Paraferrimonas sedimenticola]|uniref:Gamma-carboxygeranoyl-CoA hydratase n=1 Tax=Paraferrimonas sedimenticola TaxID=375674 RepID=A0AA37RTK5_9GAMM|nr:enoyl-CoA hydratase-related protein [Paraferrimonas sedimenticola]GLP95386.1 gamma-carboxygeranoyl-CoA hydratase [Paraferrimonas sedimenticola]